MLGFLHRKSYVTTKHWMARSFVCGTVFHCTSLLPPLPPSSAKKVKADIPTSELQDVTCHMGSRSVTCHPTQVNVPRLTQAMQAGTRFTYPEGWKAELTFNSGQVDLHFAVLNRISSHFLIPLSDSLSLSLVQCLHSRHFGHCNRYYI